MTVIKEPWELALMRQSGRKLAEVAAILRAAVRPGITTLDLDRMAEEETLRRGGIPSFKGYTVGGPPFPATICASPNEQVVHGIPNDRPLIDGDIISIDVGLVYGGYHADHAFTVAVGDVDARVRLLLEVTERSMYAGIAQARVGKTVGDIGHAVESTVKPHGFGIVEDYVGHGIGRKMHERPSVPNYGKAGRGDPLKLGMCIAIEPMITLGSAKTKTLKDGWTVVTADKSLAAHFEHTVAITLNGPEVLTRLEDSSPTS